MNRKRLRIACVLAALPVLFASPALPAAETAVATPRPNIVLILADDVGYTDIGAYGSEIRTPNLDALAAQGVMLANFHAAPLCSPSRAMLMTGVDSHVAGVGNLPETTPIRQLGKPGYLGQLNDRVETVATQLQRAGYRTYMTGKWHLGKTDGTLPHRRGFQRSFALEASGADNWEQRTYLPLYAGAPWFEDGKPATLPDDFYSSRFLVDKLVEYIDAERGDARPFFAYLAFQAAHIPVQAPRSYVEGYNGVYDGGWTAMREARYRRATQLGLVPADAPLGAMPQGGRDWDALPPAERHRLAMNMQVNAGMIEAMDHHIGRLIAHLKQTGQYDNTTFLFLSDNGPEYNDPLDTPGIRQWLDWVGYSRDPATLGGKGTYAYIGPEFASAAASPSALYKFYAAEGGLRVPMIMAGASIPQNGRVDALSFMTDIAPTLLALSGTTPAPALGIEPMTGRSLLPAIENPAQRIYGDEDAVGVETAGNAALFMGHYKLTRNRPPRGDGEWRLYDLARDPGETADLSQQMPERYQQMLQAYGLWAQRVGVLEVPEHYDAVKQLTINWVYLRVLHYGPYLVGVLLLAAALLWRRSRRRRLFAA